MDNLNQKWKNSRGQSRNPRPAYKDRYLRVGISFFCAVYMTTFRESDHLHVAIFDVNFWISVLFSFVMCMLLYWGIRYISKILDGKYPWREDPFRRILSQVGWGYALPVMLTYVLVAIFFRLIFQIDIAETEYVAKDFPMARMLILLANVYYMAWYLWIIPVRSKERAQQTDAPIEVFQNDNPQEESTHVNPEAENNSLYQSNNQLDILEPRKNSKELFLAETDDGTIPVPQEHIAAIFRQDDMVLLRTFDRNTMIIKQSIAVAYRAVNDHYFFKINARMIVNYKLCKSFKPGLNRKLDIQLGPPLNIKDEVSRYYVGDFIKWMER